MSNWVPFTVALLVFAGADIPGAESLHPVANASPSFSKDDVIPVLPKLDTPADDQSGQAPAQDAKNKGNLQEDSKLELIRYVSGEFAKAVRSLPGGKDGFLVYVGKPVAWAVLDRAVATHGAAVNTGDHVQITKLEFRDKAIIVDVNGGGRPKKGRWRDHIQFGMGGTMPTAQTTTTQQDSGPPGIQPGMGSTLFLEFEKPVPDLTPDELKQILAPFLNFAKERSASVQWIDTLPPEMKKAIQERRPLVGMDREQVVAAIGRPERKVRERDNDGNEIEDWIYGQPPSKTVFVRFMGDRVTSIRQYPQ